MKQIKKIWGKMDPLPVPFRAWFITIVFLEVLAIPLGLAAYAAGAMAVYEAITRVELYGILGAYFGIMTAGTVALWAHV